MPKPVSEIDEKDALSSELLKRLHSVNAECQALHQEVALDAKVKADMRTQIEVDTCPACGMHQEDNIHLVRYWLAAILEKK